MNDCFMTKLMLSIASFLGALAVVLGAFGAHGLKSKLDAYSLGIFQTGVLYQFIHVGALLVAGMLALKHPGALLQWAGIFFMAGIILFSGSLYLLATRSLLGIESWSAVLGPVTPLGGLCFIIGWCLMAFHVLKSF
jgi:uncharacterized membrane protein YgdD (TMEM256/DUF423 family)